MRAGRLSVVVGLAAAAASLVRVLASAPTPAVQPTAAQFMRAPYASELVSARKVDRIAWLSYEEGKRHIYTAAPPLFTPVKLASFMKDDGVEVTSVAISDDGSTVTFVRGTDVNRAGWNALPSSDPDGPDQAVWAARVASPGITWKVASTRAYELAPDGSAILFVKDGRIYRARISPVRPGSAVDRGEQPFIGEEGASTVPLPKWSPNGKRFAFASNRSGHAIIGICDVTTRAVQFMAPGVDRDANPVWSSDSRHVTFMRRSTAAPAGRGGPPAGLTLALWGADVDTGDARELWRPSADDRAANLSQVRWAGDGTFVFGGIAIPTRAGGPATPQDEWDRYYSLTFTSPSGTSRLLTTTDGLIEDATSVAISADGKTLFYCTNANDLDRRHIWAVPTLGGDPKPVTSGTGSETTPAPLASGKWVATLSASWNMPQSIGVWQEGAQKIIFPVSRPGFPADAHVEPQNVITTAADGLEIHNQLFVPKNIAQGEKRPAMVFVHGGPIRQTLLTYHYMQVISNFFAINEWLQSKGYIVLSINYRSGIGYGRSFRAAPNTEGRGNAEYQDVLAGAKYLQSRPDVDATRIGIYGLSYGGLLTAQALARNSDIFALGIDYAGVHSYGSLDPSALAYQSSIISHIDEWKSPVLFLHGDDDRNVPFGQTVGLVELLRQRDVYFELVVFPDDIHLSPVHSHWLQLMGRMDAFLQKFFGNAVPVTAPK